MSTDPALRLTRQQILAYRRRIGALDVRLPRGRRSLRIAAWSGLQDSMPRAALLSIHARVARTTPDAWEDPALVQVWGPRYSAYVVPAQDLAVFTLGRLPHAGRTRRIAEDLSARLREHLRGRTMTYGEAGRAIGVHPNALRYAALTGTVAMRWAGARAPTIWNVPPPEIDAFEARKELARRYLHVYGPTTVASFARWAGIGVRESGAAFDGLERSLMAVRTPIGEGMILARDLDAFRAEPGRDAPARFLPSGDAYFLLNGSDREMLLTDPAQRAALWTSRVWPGALLVDGAIIGVWRRAQRDLSIETWRRPSRAVREAVEAEAASLPLPGIEAEVAVRWI
jgi:hypothetical protein